MQTWVILSDLQIPFQDDKVLWNLVIPFVKELKPHGVILNGDVTDCYAISDFTKSPFGPTDLAVEQRIAGRLMSALRDPKERLWIGGNHEDRLRRYIWQNAKALATDPELSFACRFKTEENGFDYRPYGYIHHLGSLLVTHGDQVSKHSGQTARMHFEKYGRSVIIGHTHRLGSFFRRDYNGPHGAWENGCLCRLSAEWVQFPNWQQGFSIVHLDPKSGFFNVQQIPILPGPSLMYGGDHVKGGKTRG